MGNGNSVFGDLLAWTAGIRDAEAGALVPDNSMDGQRRDGSGDADPGASTLGPSSPFSSIHTGRLDGQSYRLTDIE